MLSRVLVTLAASLFLTVAALAQTTSSADENLVIQFYPSQLGSYGDMQYDFDRADLDGTGKTDYIVAVYCGNLPGVVRVLKVSGGGASLVAEAAPDAMGGHVGRLRLVDFDGDGRPEVVASFATITGGEITWIFRWSNNALALFGPTVTNGRQAVVHSILGTAEFFDVDGDGVADIVETDHTRPERRVWKRGTTGSYRITPNPVLYVNRFERHNGPPELFTALFHATSGQRLTVTVVNGDKSGNQVTSGDLFVNGKQLFAPPDFKKATRSFTATITAEETNDVESLLDGKPGTSITVSIAPAQ